MSEELLNELLKSNLHMVYTYGTCHISILDSKYSVEKAKEKVKDEM